MILIFTSTTFSIKNIVLEVESVAVVDYQLSSRVKLVELNNFSGIKKDGP